MSFLSLCRLLFWLWCSGTRLPPPSGRSIFQALCRWCRHNCNNEVAAQEVMSAVRLPLMSLMEMLNVVRPSGLLSPDNLLDAIQTRSESRDMDLNYRGMLSE